MAEAISVTICGDGGCGKSSLTQRLTHAPWTHDYDPTIEDSYSVSRVVDGAHHTLRITDTAGQDEYRAVVLSSPHVAAADAFLLVYSITARASFEALGAWEGVVGAAPGGVGVMVVGNKCDLAGSREVSSREGLAWARERGWGFMETSARECVNVEETFSALVRRVVAARRAVAGAVSPPARDSAPDTARSGMQNFDHGASGVVGGYGAGDAASEKGREEGVERGAAVAQPVRMGGVRRRGVGKRGCWAGLRCL